MKKITIEWFRYAREGQPRDRCADTSRVVEKVMGKMKTALKNVKIELELKEVLLTEEQRALSNSLKVNGKSIAEILAEAEPETISWPSRSDLAVKDTGCRTFAYGGETLDSPTEEMLEEAILAEMGPPRVSSDIQKKMQGRCACMSD